VPGLTGGLGFRSRSRSRLTGRSTANTLDSIERAVLTGGDSDNRMDASAFSGSVTLSGGAGADVLIGTPAEDSLGRRRGER
jgi:Ca2+-binding RTX toxin-like protein